jgi:hypothetical protein
VKLWVIMLVLALTSLATKTFDLVLYFNVSVRGLSIGHFQQADLELAQQHDNLLSSIAVLGIG